MLKENPYQFKQYGNEEGKLTLVPAESDKYIDLLNNPKIRKKKAYDKK